MSCKMKTRRYLSIWCINLVPRSKVRRQSSYPHSIVDDILDLFLPDKIGNDTNSTWRNKC